MPNGRGGWKPRKAGGAIKAFFPLIGPVVMNSLISTRKGDGLRKDPLLRRKRPFSRRRKKRLFPPSSVISCWRALPPSFGGYIMKRLVVKT